MIISEAHEVGNHAETMETTPKPWKPCRNKLVSKNKSKSSIRQIYDSLLKFNFI